MSNDTHIFIDNDRVNQTIKIWWFLDQGDKRINHHLKEDGTVERQEQKEPGYTMPDEFKPFITMPERMFSQLFPELVAFANKQHIRQPNEDKAKGRLEAQTEHLQDLQKLLGLKQGAERATIQIGKPEKTRDGQ